MASTHFLFISYAMRGHAATSIHIAEELARRGNRVSFAMPEEGRDWIAEPGIHFLPWTASLENGQLLSQLQHRARVLASRCSCQNRGQHLVTRSMADTYTPVFDALAPLIAESKPDQIITSQIVSPAIDAALEAQIPLAVASFFLLPLIPDSPRSAGSQTRSTSILRRAESALWQHRNARAWRRHEQQRRAESRSKPIIDLIGSGTILHMIPEGLSDVYDVPSNVHQIGAVIPPLTPLEPDLSRWLDESRDRGVIVAIFGRFVDPTAQQVRTMAAAFRKRSERVLWVLPEALRELLSNEELPFRFETYVNQPAVLAHPSVRAFVSHAGASSVTESLYWGTPIVALPFMLDQPYYAQRIVDLELGTRLNPHTMTPEALERALSLVLEDPAYTARAQSFGKLARQAPGIRGAADIIESSHRKDQID